MSRHPQESTHAHIKLGSTGLDGSPIELGCVTYGEPGSGKSGYCC